MCGNQNEIKGKQAIRRRWTRSLVTKAGIIKVPPYTKKSQNIPILDELLGVKLYLNQITIIYVMYFFSLKASKMTFLYDFEVCFFSGMTQRWKKILVPNKSDFKIKLFNPYENLKIFIEYLKLLGHFFMWKRVCRYS